jgi:pimeloyl-ACP methyl ester carboxylesterase
MVTAELDGVLPPSAAEGMDAWIDDLRTVMINDSGHWTQQEQPEALNNALLGWLNERFSETVGERALANGGLASP